MAQIFCDPSFQTMALSAPTNTGQVDDDNPGRPSDAQRKQQIEDYFSQVITLRFEAQSKAGTVSKQWSKLRQLVQLCWKVSNGCSPELPRI
jgi:hypothetical protein